MKDVTSFSSVVGFLFFLQFPTICCYQCGLVRQEDYCRGPLSSHGRKHSRQVMEANGTSSLRAASTSADRSMGDVAVTCARICPTGSRRSSDGPPTTFHLCIHPSMARVVSASESRNRAQSDLIRLGTHGSAIQTSYGGLRAIEGMHAAMATIAGWSQVIQPEDSKVWRSASVLPGLKLPRVPATRRHGELITRISSQRP